MSRNINICVNKTYFRGLDGFDSVDISNMDSIINYSVNTIIVDNLSMVDTNSLDGFLSQVLLKLAVGGQLVLRFLNTKLLAKQYSDGMILDDEYLKHMRMIGSAITVEKIYSLLDGNYNVEDIDVSEIYSVIKILRTNLT